MEVSGSFRRAGKGKGLWPRDHGHHPPGLVAPLPELPDLQERLDLHGLPAAEVGIVEDDLAGVVVEPDDHPVVTLGDLLDGLGQDDHRDVFPDQVLQDLQAALERVALEALDPRIQQQLGVVGRLAFGIEDLVRDLLLAVRPRSLPGVEDHGQTGRAAIIHLQPFLEGDRPDQMAPVRRGLPVLEDLCGKE